MMRPIAAAPPAIAASLPRPDFAGAAATGAAAGGGVGGVSAVDGASGVSGVVFSEFLLMGYSINPKGEKKV
jgi:hypothetical protein